MNMIGTIEINRLEVFGHHGVMEQEQIVGNLFEVTVKIKIEMTAAMESDCIDATVNYAEVVEVIRSEMAKSSQLLENCAWRISQALKKKFPAIISGVVKVAKPTPPITGKMESVAVEVEF